MIYKAYENHNKEKIYQKWLTDHIRYEMSFDEYYNKHIPYKKISNKEKEEILKLYGGGTDGNI